MELNTTREQHSRPQQAHRLEPGLQPARNLFVGEARPSVERPLRLGVLLELAARKLGSIEEWMLAMCEEAHGRGHQVDIFCHGPVHPELQARLSALGVGVELVSTLTAAPLAAVARLRQYDVLQLHYFGARAPVSMLAYAAWPARVLYVDRAGGMPEWDDIPLWRKAATHVLDRLTIPRLHGVIGVSDYVRERVRRRFGVTEKAQTIYNGVNLARFSPVRQPRGGGERFRLMAVAHLMPHKGVHTVLRALAKMQSTQVELHVVGDGPESKRLEALAASLGISERVQFLGLRSDVHELLTRADAFVQASECQEAFGMAIAEAMACGLPVVATRAGGIPEVVEDGQTGLIFAPGDVEGLARHLDRLAADPAGAERMGLAGRARVEALFDVRLCARRHLDVMEQAAR